MAESENNIQCSILNLESSICDQKSGTRAEWLTARPEKAKGIPAIVLRLFDPLVLLAARKEMKKESERLRRMIGEEIESGTLFKSQSPATS